MSPRLLAANCSPELLSLMESDQTIVDAVKVSEFNKPEYISLYRKLRRKRPLVLHGLGQKIDLGTGHFHKSLDRSALELAVSVAKPSYISVHLLHWIGLESVSVGPVQFLEWLVRDVELLREVTGLPVLLENSTLETGRPGVNLNAPFASDAGFIREALAASGAQFLLDLSHAQTTAWHLGESAASYVRRLPLHLVREFHMSGPALVNGEMRDRHMEVQEDGFRLLREILPATPAEVVSLEYGGLGPLFEGRSPAPVLRRQLVRLRDILAETE